MSETPTARELCRVGYEEEQNGKLGQLNKFVAGSILAARVEKVLAYCQTNLDLSRGNATNLRAVLTLLDGKE